MKYKTLTSSLLALFFSCSSLAHAEEQEIRVHLSTTSSLSPIYVGKLGGEPAFDRTYLSQLEGVLTFDLNYNGSTKVLPFNEQKEKQLSLKEPKEAFSPSVWK